MKNSHHNKLEILYKDKWIVVINKPAGLLSVSFSGHKGHSAQSMLEENLRKQGLVNAKHKPFSVHRLDRDTSGVMMFALSMPIQKQIMDNWQKMVTERLYVALSKNPYKNQKDDLQDSGTIDDELAKNAYNVGFVPKKNQNDNTGKKFSTIKAITHYKKIKKGKNYTIFELSLETGKKNQIRAHLQFHNYPIVGDFDHNSKANPFNRLCLHAKTLEFIHPITKEKMCFDVPAPKEWFVFCSRDAEN